MMKTPLLMLWLFAACTFTVSQATNPAPPNFYGAAAGAYHSIDSLSPSPLAGSDYFSGSTLNTASLWTLNMNSATATVQNNHLLVQCAPGGGGANPNLCGIGQALPNPPYQFTTKFWYGGAINSTYYGCGMILADSSGASGKLIFQDSGDNHFDASSYASFGVFYDAGYNSGGSQLMAEVVQQTPQYFRIYDDGTKLHFYHSYFGILFTEDYPQGCLSGCGVSRTAYLSSGPKYLILGGNAQNNSGSYTLTCMYGFINRDL